MTQNSGSPAQPHRPAWASRDYSLLTAATVVTGLGANGSLNAAAFAVLQSGDDGGDVGTLPLVEFVPLGGTLADRLPRHRAMVAANALNRL